MVRFTVTVAIVFADVKGNPPDTSCRKNTIPFVAHLPVVPIPLGPVRATSGPLGESTCTSTSVVPVEVHVNVVTPNPEPSHT